MPTKQRAHERQHVTEEGNYLRDDKRQHPCNGDDPAPDEPALNGVAVAVLRLRVDSEEHEARRHGL